MNRPQPVSDRYQRLTMLGEGGSGRVWLVEDLLRPGVRFALKEPSGGGVERAAAIRREFATLARLRHPGIVEAFDLDLATPGDRPRFTLELVEGVDLATAVRREGPGFFLEMAAEALRVLAFLHDFGLVHSDLKPANLLVRDRPRLGCRLVLLDLGLAAAGEPVSEAQRPARPAGTLPYMAPELFEGSPPSPRSDLYSLGALLHEVLHGAPPHVPDKDDLQSFIEVVRAGRRRRLAPPHGYPDGLARWLDELLSADPTMRPAEARESLARLNTECGCTLPAETAVSRAARLASDPPCGRDAEFHDLWLTLAPATGPRLIWLCGPAGSGKSRLLRWLRSEAILNGWHTVAPLPERPYLSTSEARESNATSFLDELRTSAENRPTLLLLDEIEAADGSLIQLLERITREAKAPPLQVVAGVRPGEVTHPLLRQLLDDTGSVPTLRRVTLEPLDAKGIRALAERATGNRSLAEARVRWLARTSEGNPLLVEALLVDGVWEKGGRGARSRILEQSVRSRLGLLSAQGLAWLEAVAVFGGNAPDLLVAELSGLTGPGDREAAEESRVAGLARVEDGRWSPDSRSMAQLVLRRIDARRSAELHRRAAGLLTEQGQDETWAWRLARLWSAAGEPERAVACAVRAAGQSANAGDPGGAAERLAYALRHVTPHDAARLELRKQQAAALMSAGRYQAAARAFGAALRLARDRGARADLLGRQAHALVQAGRFSRARAVAEKALAITEGEELSLERARAQKAIGMVLGRLGREREALNWFEEALIVLREQGDSETEAEALQNLAACKDRLGREDAEAHFLRAIELYRKLGRRSSELKSLIGLAGIHLRAGRHDAAVRLLEDVRERAVQHGHQDLLETALSKLASAAIDQGRLDRGLALSHEALDQARNLGDHNRLMVNRCRVAEALIECGRPGEAVDLLREALADSLEQVEPDMIDSTRMLLAHALLEVPGAPEKEISVPLEKCIEGFRRRRKRRSLLMALVIDLERRARPGAEDPLDPVRAEFDVLVERSAQRPEPAIEIRAGLATAVADR